ncbi:hypothetical protein QR680_015156 [Steinernema hermaphroditum]|uniref:Cytochrome b561 domain-containing protein n=1 Tax=Steinernema hermaphroditum TaxID=289476 RepID=A0AA39IBD0_9BILA|nr:hypothetical protein QR680_015156 [Steinernema hermaphroditum]
MQNAPDHVAHNATVHHHWSEPEWKTTLIKLHGIAFVIAWFFFVPIAVAGARYFRDSMTKYTPMGLRLWYHTHRTFNLIAAALMIVGLVSIFVVMDWRWIGPKVGGTRNNSSAAYHTMFGLFSVLLGWLQPFNSLLRCGPGHRLRPLFNWAHRFIGVIAWIFAATAIMIACKYFRWAFMDYKVAVASCAVVIGVVGATVLLCELIAHFGRQRVKDGSEKIHWPSFLQSTVVGFSSIALLILVTILCVLIGV